MDKRLWGTHQHHCCADHGCKYGEEDCPVVLGLIDQLYPCMDCEDNKFFPIVKLVYVDKRHWDYHREDCEDFYTLYFHTDPENAWGDDWNDVPFEYNAEIPYTPLIYHTNKGQKLSYRDFNYNKTPKFKVFQIAIPKKEIPYVRIDEWLNETSAVINTPFSVEGINKGNAPWMIPDNFAENVVIRPHMEPHEFPDYFQKWFKNLEDVDKDIDYKSLEFREEKK